jgi:CRP/FNR family cyclic AMP-dependent transcriptional regulator
VSKLLDQVPDEERRRVLAIARRRTFGRGEIVFHQGDPADSLHIVVRGRFAIESITPLGDRALVALRGPGDHFGEMGLLGDGAQRSATVSALEAAETNCVYRDTFRELRRTHPSVEQVLVEALAQELRRTTRLLVDAYYVGAEKRVLRRLHEVATLYGDGQAAVVPLTQEQLADLAGTSRALVNRVLRREEERGTVELGRGRTIVPDLSELERRAR